MWNLITDNLSSTNSKPEFHICFVDFLISPFVKILVSVIHNISADQNDVKNQICGTNNTNNLQKNGQTYLELLRLLLSFLPACKLGKSFCLFSVSLHIPQYKELITETGT